MEQLPALRFSVTAAHPESEADGQHGESALGLGPSGPHLNSLEFRSRALWEEWEGGDDGDGKAGRDEDEELPGGFKSFCNLKTIHTDRCAGVSAMLRYVMCVLRSSPYPRRASLVDALPWRLKGESRSQPSDCCFVSSCLLTVSCACTRVGAHVCVRARDCNRLLADRCCAQLQHVTVSGGFWV
jgi:hypothetical protein